MIREVGQVKAIHRYPVKSMAGQQVHSASLGWHGFDGDRRFAFMRRGVQVGFPWLTAGKLPQLIQYTPLWRDVPQSSTLPTHVRTPAGRELELRGPELQQEITDLYGSPLELIQLDQGIFDEARVSIISQHTIAEIEQIAGLRLEVARFRPNLLIETHDGKPFEEDEWVGKILRIGEGDAAPAVNIYMQDVRCNMINLDPVTSAVEPRILKAVAQRNANNAGVYASVIKTGPVSVGDKLFVQDVQAS